MALVASKLFAASDFPLSEKSSGQQAKLGLFSPPLPPAAPHIPSHLRRAGQCCLSINFSRTCFPHLFSFLIYPWLLKGLIRKM